MLTTPDNASGLSAGTAGHSVNSTVMERSPAQRSGKSIQHAEPAGHLSSVSMATVFQTTEHRLVSGQVSVLQQQSLQLLSRLEERQLLLPRESAVLHRAVLNNEAVIDPQQCRFAKSVDALRLFAAFLGIMEKSPKLKCDLAKVIKETPVIQSPFAEKVTEGMFAGSFSEMTNALEDLKLILARFDQLNSDCADPIADDVRREILGMLQQCWGKYNLILEKNWAFYPFAKPEANTTIAKYRHHLITGIDLLEQVLNYTDLHERIDKLDVKKVLQLDPEFMALLHVIGYLRIPEVPSLDAIDGMNIHRLFSVDQLYGQPYYQAKIVRASCEWVQRRLFDQLNLADGGFLDIHFNQLWVNYLNVCHVELEHLPFHHRVKELASPWIDDKVAEQVAQLIHHRERFDNVSKMPVVYYPARMINNTVTSVRRDILELYGQLLKIYQPNKATCSEDYAITGWVLKERPAKEARMEDIEWLISLVVRGGLEYDSLNSREGNRKLACPGCGFYGVLNDHEDPCDFFEDDEYFEFVINSVQSRDPLVDCSATRNIQHIHRDLMRVLWFHKETKPECTIAHAIDVQKIWNERYIGSCLAKAGDLRPATFATPANDTSERNLDAHRDTFGDGMVENTNLPSSS